MLKTKLNYVTLIVILLLELEQSGLETGQWWDDFFTPSPGKPAVHQVKWLIGWGLGLWKSMQMTNASQEEEDKITPPLVKTWIQWK